MVPHWVSQPEEAFYFLKNRQRAFVYLNIAKIYPVLAIKQNCRQK
jgi:hypothetical protein